MTLYGVFFFWFMYLYKCSVLNLNGMQRDVATYLESLNMYHL
jgi:hypothetical protein